MNNVRSFIVSFILLVIANAVLIMQGISPVILDLSVSTVLLNRWLLKKEKVKQHRYGFLLTQFERHAFLILMIVNLLFVIRKL